jgi:hypothetical protein
MIEDIERVLIAKLLAGDRHELGVLRSQYDAATVVERHVHERGFMTLFSVPDSARRVSIRSFGLTDVGFRLKGASANGMAQLRIAKGFLWVFSAFNPGEWPREPVLEDVHYLQLLTEDLRSPVKAEGGNPIRLYTKPVAERDGETLSFDLDRAV